MTAERTKRMYTKIRNCRGQQKTGLSRLQVPSDRTNFDYKNCTEWITLDAPKEIEERLLQKNTQHFGQAHGTFPTVPPYSEWVNWGASSHTAELILEGNFQDESLDKISQDLINHMKKRTDLDTIEEELTQEAWEGKMKVWPQATSTSPSGFLMIYNEALVSKHDKKLDSPEGDKLEGKRNQLIKWHNDLIQPSLHLGVCLRLFESILVPGTFLWIM